MRGKNRPAMRARGEGVAARPDRTCCPSGSRPRKLRNASVTSLARRLMTQHADVRRQRSGFDPAKREAPCRGKASTGALGRGPRSRKPARRLSRRAVAERRARPYWSPQHAETTCVVRTRWRGSSSSTAQAAASLRSGRAPSPSRPRQRVGLQGVHLRNELTLRTPAAAHRAGEPLQPVIEPSEPVQDQPRPVTTDVRRDR